MTQITELNCARLCPKQASHLLTIVNAIIGGLGDAQVCLTYKKQTEGDSRIEGRDFVPMPGIAPETLIGPLLVCTYVDNPANRKLDRVGQTYLKIKSLTRANGINPYGWANVRPEGITSFSVLGFTPKAISIVSE